MADDKVFSSSPSLSTADTERPDPRIGTVIDKYRIIRLLGRGGMGSVYEAQHVILGRRFAVKFLLREFAANRDVLRRFENEAKAAGGLEHTNIAAVTDLGRAPDDSPFLVMEYLTGQDCARLLSKEGALPASRAADIVYQACMGLSVAHKAGIVHRDIKPENLFITDTGDSVDIVKILDFGIAKLRLPDASAVTGSGVAMGTFFYMAPEQVRDSGKVDGRADVWALGVVLFELLSGRKPFEGSDASQIMYKIVFEAPESLAATRSDVSAGLIAVIDSALKKDPNERLASVIALADCLAPFAGRTSQRPSAPVPQSNKPSNVPTSYHGTTSHASVATLTNPLGNAKPSSAPKRLRWTIASLLLIGLAAVIGYWLSNNRVQSTPQTAAGLLPSAPVSASSVAQTGALNGAAAPTTSSERVEQPFASAETSAGKAPAGDVRTKSEHSLQNSNKTRINQESSAGARPGVPPRRDSTAPAPQAIEGTPEKPKAATRNPLLIDTSSPY